jgi:hypothetical protein
MALRSLSTDLTTALAGPVTKPGYLVEFAFSTPIRLSSRGSMTWNGQTWSDAGLEISGLDAESAASARPTFVLLDFDNALAAIILNSTIADVRVRTWAVYGEAPGASDPLLIFDGFGDAASATDERLVVTALAYSARAMLCPRRFIGKDAGFNFLPIVGTTATYGDDRHKLPEWRRRTT